MTNSVDYERNPLKGLKEKSVKFANISDGPLSYLLDEASTESLILCGSLEEMTREYVEEAEQGGWSFERKYIHKTRVAYFKKAAWKTAVHLCSEVWFPKCTNAEEATNAYAVLRDEYFRATKMPLLSTPAVTAHALLRSKFVKDRVFPSLPDDVAATIRRNSPQHRIERVAGDDLSDVTEGHKYDGRWMYAALAGLDRLPIGQPKQVTEFKPYIPGFYFITFTVPEDWAHIGLLPVKQARAEGDHGRLKWIYPSTPGETHETFAAEPEIALAINSGWDVQIIDGWQFEKGRPLDAWTKALVELRALCNQTDKHAGDAVRQILNHGIGALHSNTVARESWVSREEYKRLVGERGADEVFPIQFKDDGTVLIQHREAHSDKIRIFMPHWSASIYALERARLAYAALQVPRDLLLHFQGDAIYASEEVTILDNGRLGQFRYQDVADLPKVGERG